MAIEPFSGIEPLGPDNRVRLRTLVLLRWLAVVGQLVAIFAAQRLFALDLNVGLCLAAVGASASVNLVLTAVYPVNRRLTEREVIYELLFDIAQLGALLYLTGGMENPFALLILAPVAIAATALGPRATLIVGAAAAATTSFVGLKNMPLVIQGGEIMNMPAEFEYGFWVAIMIGIAFLGLYAQRVASEIETMSRALLATQMALAREQQLTALSGVVAATAHELGTPLATIKLASAELVRDLADRAELQQDAALIAEQADRCRDILHSMGRAGKEDRYLAQAPLSVVLREAAEPHLDRGKNVEIASVADPETDGPEPEILRLPEVIHGVRNLVQNAVDFAETTVWIDIAWTRDRIELRIIDDGRGFSPHLIGRIGDPFVRNGRGQRDDHQRPGYRGMGLGLFIAKTLLERTGAELQFENARHPFATVPEPGKRSGAIVELTWPRARLEPVHGRGRRPLGENPRIQA